MKKSLFALFSALVVFCQNVRAQQPAANPYDLLGRVLTPIASVFCPEAPQHALSATLVLEEMTDLPQELAGARVELFLEPPYRVLLRGPYQGRTVTICREGDGVWITPKAPPFDTLPNTPGEPPPKQKKKKGQSAGLGPMVLPFPPQQLALLPILFQVRDAGEEKGLRVLEARLMRELARSLGVEEWSARLSVNEGGRLERLRILGPGWSLAVRVERQEYAAKLPAATWQPGSDALRLNAQQVLQWIDVLGRQMETHRPTQASTSL